MRFLRRIFVGLARQRLLVCPDCGRGTFRLFATRVRCPCGYHGLGDVETRAEVSPPVPA